MTNSLIPADMAVSAKFSAFDLVDVNYKFVNGTGIPATILVRKNIRPGGYPVLVRWHGGCFITGHRMYPDWFPNWILELAISHSAVVISPDYRLLPESNGLDILQDVRDFFEWLTMPGNLSSHLPQGVQPDLAHLLVTGESAGGWLALQSALLVTSRKSIAGVISHYPMIDLRDAHYTSDHEKQLFTPVAPPLDRSILRNYLADMKGGTTIITSATPPDRVPLVISILQQGLYATHFGTDSALYPLEVLEHDDDDDGDGLDLPPMWILHGMADSVIPVEGTRKFEKLVREKVPRTKTLFYYADGADHGFDNASDVTMETGWVREGVRFVERVWPHRR